MAKKVAASTKKSAARSAAKVKGNAKPAVAKAKGKSKSPPVKPGAGGALKKLLSTVAKRVGAVGKSAAKAPKPAAAKAGSKPIAKPAKGPAAKPVKKAVAKPVKKAVAKPAKKVAAKPAKKVVAKPVKKVAAKPLKKVPVKAVKKSVTKPIPKPTKKVVVQPAKKASAKPVAVVKSAAQPAAKAPPIAKAVVPVKPAASAKTPVVAKSVPEVKAPVAKADSAKAGKAGKVAKVPEVVIPQPPAPRPRLGKVAVAVPVAEKKQGMPMASLGPIKVKEGEVVRPKLPAGYKPSAKETYMSPLQVEFFRQKLVNWRADLVEESKQTIDNLRDEVRDVGDDAERATRETENSLELRTRDRYRKLLSKIDKALRRIDEGEYGFCEETGEEIGLDRLEARPIATLCLDAQERWEIRQRQMGD
jgi:DnaK suppressor protein